MAIEVVTIEDFINKFEEKVPTFIAESWDNVGFLVGNRKSKLKGMLLTLDVNEETIKEAVENNCNLIFSHHPFIFSSLKSVTEDKEKGKMIIDLIKNEISVYSAHTNLDMVSGGLNDVLMEMLDLKNSSILVLGEDSNVKNYGTGRVCDCNLRLGELIEKIKSELNPSGIRYSGDINDIVKRVAVINGSGADFIKEASKASADCVITGDTKYHEVQMAKELGINVIDPGHFDTEWKVFLKFTKKFFSDNTTTFSNIQIIESKNAKDFYSFY